jgi:hypothetical protein
MERAPDPADWRTWARDGVWIFPPESATREQAFDGWRRFCMARWGRDPDTPQKDRRNVGRVLKKIDGKYVQICFRRVVDGKRIDVRVRGGCRS